MKKENTFKKIIANSFLDAWDVGYDRKEGAKDDRSLLPIIDLMNRPFTSSQRNHLNYKLDLSPHGIQSSVTLYGLK